MVQIAIAQCIHRINFRFLKNLKRKVNKTSCTGVAYFQHHSGRRCHQVRCLNTHLLQSGSESELQSLQQKHYI